MPNIENNSLAIEVKTRGAELSAIRSKLNGVSYLWNGDKRFWAKHSPVLFPIVGTVREDKYYHNGQPFHLTRHGFARDSEFILTDRTDSSLLFTLESNAESLSKYPFNFKLNIRYSLIDDRLHTDYEVTNTGAEVMYFSIGGHPAFNLPLEPGLKYEDYHIQFSEMENAPRWMISKEGLIKSQSAPLIENTNLLKIDRALFEKDAVVLKNLRSDSLTLRADAGKHGLEFEFAGFPYLGLWAAQAQIFFASNHGAE